MSTRPYRIGVPWQTPVVSRYNGVHPLPLSLLGHSPEFHFAIDLQPRSPEAEAAVAREADALRGALRRLPPPVTDETIEAFIESRDFESQVMMSAPMDLLFLHTVPATFGQRPWTLHIESTLPMFEPFFGHFRTADIDLEATPAWHFVRHLVCSPECRGIYTHIKGTRDALPTLFRDDALAGKIFHAPLGIGFTPEVWRKADAAIHRKNAKTQDDELVVLFTNSWHQDPDSFYKRGGGETLMAFADMIERGARCRLLLRSALPEAIDPVIREQIRRLPGIELFEQPLSDEELFDLLYRADVFVLPSANLHTISYLRAMATGAVVVTTDVVAVEEFLTDGETGIVLPGRRGVSYWEDHQQGLLREDLEPIRKPNPEIAQRLGDALRRLMADRDLRNRLRLNARRRVDQHHTPGPWREGFYEMLRRAVEPRAS